MNRLAGKAFLLAGAVAGIAALRRRTSAPTGGQDSRWLTVTVNRKPDEVTAEMDELDPVRRLGDRVELRVQPAPADKGTEVLARPREQVPAGAGGAAARIAGDDPRQEVRLALRQAKSLLETGEVLRPTSQGSTHPPTPAGKLLDLLIGRSRGEGRL
jgi:uncharacterized membrane protein